MRLGWTRQRQLIFCGLGLLLLAGCGGSETSSGDSRTPQPGTPDVASGPDTSVVAEAAPSVAKSTRLPDASIETQQPQTQTLEEGTPEWYLRQIRETRVAAIPETDDLDQLRVVRRERNDKIVELAYQLIAQTHESSDQSQLFNTAVSELMEARLQNALQGGEEEIDTLYGDANDLVKRDPESESAMIASYALVRFAHTNARRFAAKEPRWIDEFSKQARLFAGNYPREEAKILPLLSAAAITCELHGNQTEARLCHALLAEQFPESPQGRNSLGVLRRLNLEGQPLEFAGPTPDGGFISLENYEDKVLLVVFWSSDNEDFGQQLPELKSLYEKYSKFGFDVAGVCMDEDEPALNQWLEEHPLPWRHVFCTEPTQRRWQNPVAQYYGVRELPTYWLVDHAGIVRNTKAIPSELEPQLRDLLLALREKQKSAASNEEN